MMTMEENNKTLVLEAFNTLFNKRDYEAAARYWSPNYIQHSAHIEPGREGLFNLIKASPASLKYEPGVIVAEGDFVIVHGRFSGTGLPRNWIAADVVRIADGVLAEHWDALQDEAARAESKGGLPMFGGRVHPDDEIRKRKRVVLIARRSLPIYPMNGHRKIGPACLKSANGRHRKLELI